MRSRLASRVRFLRHDCDRYIEKWASAIAARLPLRLRRAVIVDAAVRATHPDLIGPDAYAGPDGVDYRRMWEAAARPR